jgi:hypothetical protein
VAKIHQLAALRTKRAMRIVFPLDGLLAAWALHKESRSITKPLKAQDLKFSFNCSRFPTPYEHYSPIGIDRTFAALGVQAHGDVLVYRSNNGSTFVLRKTAQSETPTDKSNSGKDPPLVSPLAQRLIGRELVKTTLGPFNALTDQTEKCNHKTDGP